MAAVEICSPLDLHIPWETFSRQEKIAILDVLRRDSLLRQNQLVHVR